MRVLLAGGSGLIGTALRAQLGSAGHEVRMLLRSDAAPDGYRWLGIPGSVPKAAVDWADAIVSLNGVSLSQLPWTKSYRESIRRSRVAATQGLAEAIAESADPPRVWVSGSAVGYYGDATGEADLTESSPAGTSFLAQIVGEWERATRPAESRTRVVNARTGLVIARSGALAPLAFATRFGAGARIGPGNQWWPWISLEDEARAIAFALEADSLRGPVNLVGPTPATAEELTRALAKAMHRPHWFVLPTPLIKVAMSGASELLLSSQKVHPAALTKASFTFTHPTPESAIAAALIS
jgi:uncharacterized protein (TIGR01777 family)